jgi:hypothetical protein
MKLVNYWKINHISIINFVGLVVPKKKTNGIILTSYKDSLRLFFHYNDFTWIKRKGCHQKKHLTSLLVMKIL